jgi:hypothetical protein
LVRPALVFTVVSFFVLAIAALAGSPAAVAQDDNLRCGSRLITVGMAASQVKEICGDPRSTQVEQVPVYARNPAGTGVRQTGTTQVETWIYDRGAAQFPARLKFEEGKLVSIELVRPGEDD